MAYLAGIVNSEYNGLQTSLRKRFGYGVSFLASYVYSKSLDDNSSFNMTGGSSQDVAGENDLAQNPFDLRAEHGRSLFDQRQRFVFSHEWQLPSLGRQRAWSRRAFRRLAAQRQPHAGHRHAFYRVRFHRCGAAGERFGDLGFLGEPPQCGWKSERRPEDRAGVVQRRRLPEAQSDHPSRPVRRRGPQCDQAAGIGQYDFSVFKNFQLTESSALQFRAEFFNIFNRVNFGLPENDISSPTFGQVQSALAPREIQFALKLRF